MLERAGMMLRVRNGWSQSSACVMVCIPDRTASSGDSGSAFAETDRLEHEKLLDEYKELLDQIAELCVFWVAPIV